MPSANIFNAIAPVAPAGGSSIFTTLKWCQVTVLKETSGVIFFGSSAGVTSGQGIELPSDVAITFIVGPNTSLYISANTPNEKVGFIIQELPESIFGKGFIPGISPLPSPLIKRGC